MMPRYALFGCTSIASSLFLIAFSGAANATTLAEALSAYRDNRVAEAERMLAEVAADPAASAQDRAGALRELGRIDGLVRGETDGIATAMAQVTSGEETCPVAATALRVYRDAGQAATPLAYAQSAIHNCTPAAAEALRVETARTHLALAASDPTMRANHLAISAEALAGIDAAAGGSPDVAGARFSLAMSQRDAAAAFQAWRAYYWLNETDAPQALSAYTGRVEALFAVGLAPNAGDADALALLDLLVRAGFTADARQYAAELGWAARNRDSSAWRRIDSYFTFDAAVREATLRANREMASGGRARWYQRAIREATDALLEANDLSTRGNPTAALAEHFGVYGTFPPGETSGYPSLHGGHLAQDERMHVSQYGREGEVRFIVVDNMLANGYESWLWDGWAEAGGWSSDGNVIVQVRSAYTDGPLRRLRRTRPGPERDRYLASLADMTANELRALGQDGVAPTPATAAKLEMQVMDQIVARVGNDDAAFIAEVWRGTNQTSIESHEGRHALDNANERGLSVQQLEFRAKLSQIIFADYPRLGLASVAGGQHNDTGHGVGNRLVMEGYRNWMREHRGEIAGFDANRPTLSQLDLLTDPQIVAAARSMDPWRGD
jgi:hypothetical protein